MNLPNMLNAKVRGKSRVDVLYDDYNTCEIDNIGNDKKYLILTYGCQMNVHDSEYIAGIMDDLGYTSTLEMDEASVIIVNTCAIRENAHNKAEGMLGRIKHLKEEKNDEVVVIFCGCMAQEELNETMSRSSENIVKTYYIDSSDLSAYASAKDYNKGKVNPFEDYTSENTKNNTNTSSNTSTTNKKNTNIAENKTTNTVDRKRQVI